MTTNTCHDCQKPVNRSEAALRSVAFIQVAFHPNCLKLRLAVDAVFSDPAVVVAGHSERVA